MDSHAEALRNTCRLCGKQGFKRSYPKEKLRDVIQRSLSVDVSADDQEIHPQPVCIICERKLSRWKVVKHKSKTAVLNITVPDFQPHGADCSVCSTNIQEDRASNSLFDNLRQAAASEGMLVKEKGERLFAVLLDNEGNTQKCLIVLQSGEWEVKVQGKNVNKENVFAQIPSVLTEQSINELVSITCTLNVCIGNSEFSIPPNMLNNRPVYTHHLSHAITIRHNSCSLLTPDNTRCSACRIYRSSLSKLHQRLQKDMSPAPKTNLRYMNTKRLASKLAKSRKNEKGLKKRIASLEQTIDRAFEERARWLSEEDNSSFNEILTSETENVLSEFKEDSPMRLLWEQQVKRNKEHPKAMRWHPSIIRLCIALQAKSPAAYELLRNSGYLSLPHQRTLKHYTHFTSNTPGFNHEIIRRVMDDINIDNLEPHQRSISLSFDEMKINEGLVYSHSTGNIIGFTSLGNINDELASYTQRCMSEDSTVATHVLTIMIRGICASYHAPIAYFATSGASSDQLYSIILEAVEVMELHGLHVRAIVSDGASSNRTFYNLLRDNPDSCSFVHPTTKKEIFLFSDVPHLLKTCRNNFENSGYHTKTRNLMFRGLPISWQHIIDVYEWDMTNSTGLRMLHRIRDDHIHLTPAHRMKVKLAAQVLSTSVANALTIQGLDRTKSTRLFISYIDNFFDCMNVTNISGGMKKRKATLEPYKQVTDWRFIFLEEDFLSFLDEWESEGNLTFLSASEKEKLCLSRQTLEGLRMTVRSFVCLAKRMLREPGVKFILSDKFSQDPLEEYFSKQRGVGGRFDNPSVSQFGSNMQTLQVAGGAIRASKRANVSILSPSGSADLEDKPIPRKKLFKK